MNAQRWAEGATRWVTPAHKVNTAELEVVPLTTDTEARQFITTHHYAHSYPAARFRYGLYRRGTLVGVAVYSHPTNNRTLTNVFEGPVLESVELGRFCLLDEVGFNAETWFLARTFRMLKTAGISGVVSFSDPVPRVVGGHTLFPGHIGTIYTAHNAQYLGRGTARTLQLLPDGTVANDRSIQKIRQRERGYEAMVRTLEAHGAEPFDPEDPDWLSRTLRTVCTPMRHAGNHRYAWVLGRGQPKLPRLPYPKAQATVALAV